MLDRKTCNVPAHMRTAHKNGRQEGQVPGGQCGLATARPSASVGHADRITSVGASARIIGGRISGMSDKRRNRRRQIKQSIFWYAVAAVVVLLLAVCLVSIERATRARETAALFTPSDSTSRLAVSMLAA